MKDATRLPWKLLLILTGLVLIAFVGFKIEGRFRERTAQLHISVEETRPTHDQVPRAEIQLYGPEPCTGKGDKYGRCDFHYLTPGTYRVKVAKAGYTLCVDTFQLEANTERDVTYELRPLY